MAVMKNGGRYERQVEGVGTRECEDRCPKTLREPAGLC